MESEYDKKLGLSELFLPPKDNKRGIYCMLCGLSADEPFIEKLLDNFSGLSKNQRKNYGINFMSMFLDFKSKPFVIPGMYSPYPNNKSLWPISAKLMHAKIALLGFGNSTHGKPDYFRLIVSTGNWTKEAVNNNINLVWYCDYDINLNNGRVVDQTQEAINLHEAIRFWEVLLGLNKSNGFYAMEGELLNKIKSFIDVTKFSIQKPSIKISSQFISNIFDSGNKNIGLFTSGSIGEQVLSRISKLGNSNNFLICGSGFFENSPDIKKNSEPEILLEIIKFLESRNLLIKKHNKWLVFNGGTSGSLGAWLKGTNISNIKWSLRVTKHPESKTNYFQFHAKYIFIANYNEANSNGLTKTAFYLGSGNLSKQGFASTPGKYGNIEAGVFIEEKKYPDADDFFKNIGIHPSKEFDIKKLPVEIESEEDEKVGEKLQLPPPILFFIIIPAKNMLNWHWYDESYTDITFVISGEEFKINKTDVKFTIKDYADLRNGIKLIGYKNGIRYEWIVPVLNINGNFYVPQRPKTAYDMINSLSAFPFYPDEDERNEEGGEIETFDGNASAEDAYSPISSLDYFRNELEKYPMHLATTLVETIAAGNQRIQDGQMPDWIFRLRHELIECAETEIVEKLVLLKINFMKVLIDVEGFAPKSNNLEYKKLIKDIIDKWGLNKFI